LQSVFTLIALAFSQSTQAVNPPPNGGFAGGNTAQRQNALWSLTTGADNSYGTVNTAMGDRAPIGNNTNGSNNTANRAL